MAAITTAQSGNWSATSTWTGGVIPGNGDSVTLNHSVNLDSNRTLGTSGPTGTVDMTIASGVSLTFNAGAQLIMKGAIQINGNGQIIQVAGSGLEWQVPSGQIYVCRIGDQHNMAPKWTINGTSGNRCYVRNAAGGGTAWISDGTSPGPWLQAGLVNATYCDFTRLGAADRACIRTSPSADGNVFSLSNCVFDTCGRIEQTYNLAGGATFKLENVTFQNSLQSQCLQTAVPGLRTGAGVRSITGCVFDKIVYLYAPTDFTIQSCYFFKGFSVTEGAGPWAYFENNFVRATGTGDGGADVIAHGDVYNTFFFYDDASEYNPHFMTALRYVDSQYIQGCIFEATNGNNSPSEEGDCIMGHSTGPASSVMAISDCIVLPNRAGKTTGTLVSLLGRAGMDVRISKCTVHVGSQAIIHVGESYAGHTGMVDWVRSCIAWNVTPGTGYKISDVGTNDAVTDLVSAANANYNCGYQILAGSNAKGYNLLEFSSGSPGANDVDVNPNFVDASRDIAKFGETYLGATGTEAQKVTTVLTHFSRRNDPTYTWGNGVNVLLAYVRAGFAPQNASLATAGHDGGVIGAVAYAPPAGSPFGLSLLGVGY